MKKRPSPQQVVEILQKSRQGGLRISGADLVRAICRDTGVSRATAYRACAEALREGAIRRKGEP